MGVPEAVVVQGEECSVKAAVRTDGGNVVVVTSATNEDTVPGDRGVGTNPLGGNVGPRALAVTVWLVHWLEVDLAVAGVPGGDGLPHGPEARHVVDPTVLGRASALPVTQDHFEAFGSGGVDRAGVRVPEGTIHGVGIDRHPYCVRAQIRRESADDRAGFRIGRGIAIPIVQA